MTMDLESECSALESVEDNEVGTQEVTSNVDDDNKNNGSCSIQTNKPETSQNRDINALPLDKDNKVVENVQSLNSPPLGNKFPPGVTPPTTKGYGLKKWRRIRRDFNKDAGPSNDTCKILKRGFSGPVNPAKPSHLSSGEIRQNSEGSVGSANLLKNIGIVDGFPLPASSLDSRLAVGSAFAVGTDSDNSEDRSSKSSTAASAPKGPKGRYELPVVMGHARERNRSKNLVAKSGGNSTQRIQQGNSRAESSKKPRGDEVKMEKENSLSSMESDSRSSNVVFMQGASSVTSNGKHNGISMNYDGENSDCAHACEHKDNDVEVSAQDDSAADASWDAKERKNENHQSSADRDPLVESIHTLQSVQEALEKEVLKLGEIGKDAITLHNNLFSGSSAPAESTGLDQEIIGPNLSDPLISGRIGESASNSLETQVIRLNEMVKHLESKLEEARAMIKVKESRVTELEATLNSGKPLKEESGSTVELQPENSRETETEFEVLFRQKIEAEIEYLALTRTIQKCRVTAGDQSSLFQEQESVAEEQARMLNKLGKAESKATGIKKQAEELEKYREDVLVREEVLKTQNRVCKVSSCVIIQLMLLGLVLWVVYMQWSRPWGVIVPT